MLHEISHANHFGDEADHPSLSNTIITCAAFIVVAEHIEILKHAGDEVLVYWGQLLTHVLSGHHLIVYLCIKVIILSICVMLIHIFVF